MAPRLNRLGLKLNLSLLILFLLLGAATAASIFIGFRQSQDTAEKRSREALQELGKLALQALVGGATETGGVQFESAAEIGQRAAFYMQASRARGEHRAFDTASLASTASGLYYDPTPDRESDIILLARTNLDDPAVQDELALSALLDDIFAVLLESFEGEAGGRNFDPSAITFVGVSGVTRYFPPRGIHEIVSPDTDISGLMTALGPQGDPDRKTIWPPPYEDNAGQGLVVTANTPVYVGDEFRGVIQVDLLITRLIDEINGIRPTPSGFAFYLDTRGDLLRTDAFDLLSSEASGNQRLANVLDRIRTVGNQAGSDRPGGPDRVAVDTVTIQGREYFVAYAPMLPLGGTFAVAAPVDEVTAQAAAITSEIGKQANRTMVVVLGSMTLLFGLALAGATYFNRRVLVRPISALAAGTRAVTQGDYGTTIAVSGNDELAALGHSFNRMTDDIQREMREREAAQEELRALFAAMTDVVLVLDSDGRYLRIAPTKPDLLYAPAGEMLGRTLHEIMPPDRADFFVENIRASLRDRVARSIEYPMQIRDRELWFSATVSPISGDSVVFVARDITERVNARQVLERQVEERTQSLQTLLEMSQAVTSTLDLQDLYEVALDHLRELIPYTGANIGLWTPEGPRQVASRRPAGLPSGPVRRRPNWEQFSFMRDLAAGKPLVIADVRGHERHAAEFRESVDGHFEESAWRYIRSLVTVPLIVKSSVIGDLSVSHAEPAYFQPEHVELAQSVANHVAIAIENARLFEETDRKAKELEALYQADQKLFASLDLDDVLQSLADIAVDVLGADKSMVSIADGPDGRMAPRAWRNVSEETRKDYRERLLAQEATEYTARVVAAEDLDQARPESRPVLEKEGIAATLEVPIVFEGQTRGAFGLAWTQRHAFTDSEKASAAALAQRAAVAIKNAEVYARAQQAASLEERQRLARELHDSVSQALYGIALGARTARTQLDREPLQAAEPLDYVLSLAEAGLAEMRALIFELRPESLETEGLVAALEKQIAATRARHGLAVTANLCPEPDVALGVKEAAYRIAQEALHNIVKHAQASSVLVELADSPESLQLTIADDGRGFDAGADYPGHMGLGSMRERAARAGASIVIEATLGNGSRISVNFPKN